MLVSPLPAWGTLREAADLLSISTQTARRYISQGRIRAERVGPRLIRVDLNSLEGLGSRLPVNGGDE